MGEQTYPGLDIAIPQDDFDVLDDASVANFFVAQEEDIQQEIERKRLLREKHTSSKKIITAKPKQKNRIITKSSSIIKDSDVFLEYPESIRDDTNKLLTGELIKAVCSLSLEEHAKQKQKTYNWEWKEEYANKIKVYLESCRHVKDQWAEREEYIKLEPWEIFFVGELNGWRQRDEPLIKRYREYLLECAKKQGKTIIGAGICLYNTQLEAKGGEIYSVARQQDQAKLSWDVATQIVPIFKHKKLVERIRITYAGANGLKITDLEKNSFFKPLSKETKSTEGINASFGLFDEAAAIEKEDAITVVLSSAASRIGPQFLYITTPQFRRNTLYYKKRSLLAKALRAKNRQVLDRMSGLLFCADEGDDWQEFKTWEKANPNLGVSVYPVYLEERLRDAQNIPSQKNEILIHHAGQWVGAVSSWLDQDIWKKGDIPQEELDLTGKGYLGVDLATVNDLCGITGIFEDTTSGRIKKYHAFAKAWLPAEAYANVPDEEIRIYDEAIEQGHLIISGESIVDLDEVYEYILELTRTCNIQNIGFDPHNATIIINRLIDLGIPCLSIPQTVKHLNAPAKLIESLVLAGKLKHVENTFMDWQLESSAIQSKPGDDIKIVKAEQGHSKIDNVIGLINAAACIDEIEEKEGEAVFFSTDEGGTYYVTREGKKIYYNKDEIQ